MLAKLIEAGAGDRERFDPEVLSLITPGKLGGRIHLQNVPVHTLGMRQGAPSLTAVVKLARTIGAIRPSLIQGWMHHGNIAASFGAWMLRPRPPVVWNIRHSLVDLGHEKPLTRVVLRLSAVLSSTPAAIIYNSRVAARQYEAFGFPNDRTVIIPNGFDCDHFRPDVKARQILCRTFGISEGVTVVGMVARFHPMKDPGTLVDAVRRARLAGRDLHLLLVGSGFEKPPSALAATIRMSLPKDRVTMVGDRHDVGSWLPGLDILALPSAWGEGFPNILGEAMACGVACVATDVGDSAWIMGGHGRVVPPRDAEAMAQALEWLTEIGANGRGQIGAAARARVVELFSLAQVARQYEALYEEVLDKRRRLPRAPALAM